MCVNLKPTALAAGPAIRPQIQRSVPSATPCFPCRPAGDRRALPAPAQGIHPLRIPFWGTAAVSPQPPSPKNAEGGRPLLMGLPPSIPLPLHPNETQNARPLLVGRAFVDLEPTATGRPHCGHSRILVTTPEPTVRPPSRIAKRRPSSHAIGVIKVISMSMLSPGITISTPSGSLMLPVTSVVRK